MAEFVQRRMEKCIPELEQMSRIGIFTDGEVRKIIKKRKEFEYKIQRIQKHEKDYVNYIDYEIKLLEKIRIRRKEYRIQEKKNDIDYAIKTRIMKLYQELLLRHGTKIKYWISYIAFGTRVKYYTVLAKGISRMIEINSYNPEVWKVAAIWHLEELKCPDEARKLLLRGLQHNPGNVMLYLQLFRLELQLNADQEKSKKEKTENDSLENIHLKSVEIIFEQSLTEIKNEDSKIDLALKFLRLAKVYKLSSLQDKITSYLIETYPLKEIVWNTMANRELKGRTEENLISCIQVYESAVEQIPTKLMWNYYIESVLRKECFNKSFKYRALKKALDASTEQETFLSEDQCYLLVKMEETDKELLLATATEVFPQSEMLWCERIKYYLGSKDNSKIEEIFQEGLQQLKNKSLKLWRLKIEYYKNNSNLKKVSDTYKEAMKRCIDSDGIEVDYLVWLVRNNDIQTARKTFLEIVQSKASVDVYFKMYELEKAYPNPAPKIMRRILEQACQQFGKTNLDVWLRRLRFELEFNPILIGSIYSEAQRILDQKYRNDLEREYEKLRAEF